MNFFRFLVEEPGLGDRIHSCHIPKWAEQVPYMPPLFQPEDIDKHFVSGNQRVQHKISTEGKQYRTGITTDKTIKEDRKSSIAFERSVARFLGKGKYIHFQEQQLRQNYFVSFLKRGFL